MVFYVYMLRCADGSYYTGHTERLEYRLEQHHLGADPRCYTFSRRPLELAYCETFASRLEALACERRIKGWSRRKKEALIRADWPEIVRLARGRRSEREDP